MDPADRAKTIRALNRLAKWRVLLTGWQLGTRPKGDPEGDAVRDHREATLLLQATSNALVQLLVAKGVFTEAELNKQLSIEARELMLMLEGRFPGVRATDNGLEMTAEAQQTMAGWKP